MYLLFVSHIDGTRKKINNKNINSADVKEKDIKRMNILSFRSPGLEKRKMQISTITVTSSLQKLNKLQNLGYNNFTTLNR